MHDFGECYAVLGLSPDTEWDALRAHYRRLIRQWHPDRFSAGSAQQRLAEERIKQITAAYQALEIYHRDHGVLPPARTAATPQEDVLAPSNLDKGARSAHAEDLPDAPVEEAQAFASPTRRRWRWRGAVLLLVMFSAVLYVAIRNMDVSSQQNGSVDERVSEPVAAPSPPRPVDTLGEQHGISVGSTIGDVYSIQGVPTATQGNTWYYGKSRVQFAQGAVIAWQEEPGYPLRIARDQQVQPLKGRFKFGSTKDEVRAIQGNPVTETATVWDYGLSRIYFENNRVVRWEESPMQRLHVSR